MSASPEQWELVARSVEQRRNRELRITQQQAVDRSAGLISLPVWSVLENAKQRNGTMTVRALDGVALALDWPDDWYLAVFRGETPQPVERMNGHQSDADSWDDLKSDLSEADRAAVRAIIDQLRAKHH